jgi:YbbR domain-containing protein
MAIIGLRHIGLKILSIALAALLWVLVSGEQLVERVFRVPLEFTNVPSKLELVSDPLLVIEVRVRGSSGALGRIGPGELVAVLDLTDASVPQRVFHLSPSDVRTPFGVEVAQVSPSSVTLDFEPLDFKKVPVVATVEGEPADGFAIGTKTAEPSIVELVGPVSELATVTEAITEPVSVKGSSKPVSKTVTIGSPHPAVRLRKPQTARVLVNVIPAPAEWSVAGVAVQIRNAGRRQAEVTPTTVTLQVRGPREAQGARPSEFDAWVDVTNLHGGQFDLPVQVLPPPKVAVEGTEPARVRVTVR